MVFDFKVNRQNHINIPRHRTLCRGIVLFGHGCPPSLALLKVVGIHPGGLEDNVSVESHAFQGLGHLSFSFSPTFL